MVGRTLSHYRILERSVQAYRGEVYRARNTKLRRDVAIKVLPEASGSSTYSDGRFGTSDAQKFLVISSAGWENSNALTLVTNWPATLPSSR